MTVDLAPNQSGMGRELFDTFRRIVGPSTMGASSLQ
jgi:hypothetical protein